MFTRVFILLFPCFLLVPLRADARSRRFELKAESPEFWKLIDHNAQLTRIGMGFGFTEGPVWDPSGFLYVSDEVQNKIYRLYLDGRKEEVIALGDPERSTYDRHHRLLDCASVLRAIISITPDGHYTVLADHYDGKKFNSPNDVVIGPDGAIYFTDPTLDLVQGEKQEIPFQGVYRLDDKGKVRLLTKDLHSPMASPSRLMASTSTWTTAKREIFASMMSRLMAHSAMAASLAKSQVARMMAFPMA